MENEYKPLPNLTIMKSNYYVDAFSGVSDDGYSCVRSVGKFGFRGLSEKRACIGKKAYWEGGAVNAFLEKQGRHEGSGASQSLVGGNLLLTERAIRT